MINGDLRFDKFSDKVEIIENIIDNWGYICFVWIFGYVCFNFKLFEMKGNR